MGALAQPSQSVIDVEPGHSATISLTIRNTGMVVDRFTFQALGALADSVTFNPPSVSLFPDASETVNVVIAPPRDPSVAAGPVPLGLRVISSEDFAGSVVEEATVNVGTFSDITVELIPKIATGRIAARTRLVVDNRSNCPYRAEVSGSDPKGTLRFSFRPAVVDVPSGGAVFSKLSIHPTRRFWRGPPKTHAYRVVLVSGGGLTPGGGPGLAPPPPTPAYSGAPVPSGAPSAAVAVAPPTGPHKTEISAEGSMLQESMLPRWLLAALAIIALLVLLWFLLLKPTIHNEATTAANSAVAPLNKQVAAANKTAAAAAQTANGAASKVGAPVTPISTTTTTIPGPLTTSAGSRVSVSVAPGATATQNLPNVPASASFEMTDVVFENAAGDTGTVSIMRGSQAVLQENLANFRSLDYHFVSPITFPAGTAVTFQVVCTNPAGQNCTPGAYIGGYTG